MRSLSHFIQFQRNSSPTGLRAEKAFGSEILEVEGAKNYREGQLWPPECDTWVSREARGGRKSHASPKMASKVFVLNNGRAYLIWFLLCNYGLPEGASYSSLCPLASPLRRRLTNININKDLIATTFHAFQARC